MRISDWSSDVCSSDLFLARSRFTQNQDGQVIGYHAGDGAIHLLHGGRTADKRQTIVFIGKLRSEEHTSELQSLMRISYAVFCLKKQTAYAHIQVALGVFADRSALPQTISQKNTQQSPYHITVQLVTHI